MARHVAVCAPGARRVTVFEQVAALWVPRARGQSQCEIADLALNAGGWRRTGEWSVSGGTYCAPIEPDHGGGSLEMLARDQQIGDERRSAARPPEGSST